MSTTSSPVTDAVVVAAGSGSRLGLEVPKAFVEVAGAPLLAHALRHLAAIEPRFVTITIPPEEQTRWREVIAGLSLPGDVQAVAGGETRQDSVRIGLRSLRHRYGEEGEREADVVLVHDAARPCASARLWCTVRDTALHHGAAIPVLPVVDCLKRVDSGGRVIETLDRNTVARAQTPQAFRLDWLWAAHQCPGGAPAADDAELVERLGHPVVTVPGEASNLKVTTSADLEIARWLLETLPG